MKRIEWGTYKFKGKADVVAKEIEHLGTEVKPEQIVAYAEQNPDSELHKCFTWDDTKAAIKYRLHEARLIVCNLKLVIADAKTEAKSFRLMFKNESTGGYKQTTFILKQADEYEKLLDMAKSELYAFQKKYESLVELESIFELIDEL